MVWRPSPNFTEGREGERVEQILAHWTVGTAESAIARFQNADPRQLGGRASAHYIVRRDGSLVQMVKESDTAWHAGDFLVNLRSIGIEIDAGPGRDVTDAQYAASARLIREIAARYGLSLDAEHVIPHRKVVATQCPGTLDIARLLREAEGMTEDEVREIAKAECRAVLSNEAWLPDAITAAVERAVAEVARRLAA